MKKLCEICGKPIHPERIKARPNVKTCSDPKCIKEMTRRNSRKATAKHITKDPEGYAERRRKVQREYYYRKKKEAKNET